MCSFFSATNLTTYKYVIIIDGFGTWLGRLILALNHLQSILAS